MTIMVRGLVSILAAVFMITSPAQGQSPVTAHWQFNGDLADSSGNDNHGRGFGVDLSAAGRSGKPNTAARFNGVDAMIEVAESESLQFGTGDFSIAAWVLLDEDVEDIVGDIVSKFDDEARRGFNFCIKASSANYSSLSDVKIPVFGIDNAVDGGWLDCGKPWRSNTLISTLTIFQGRLFAGIADALSDKSACHVYRYDGKQRWIDCGRVGDSVRTRTAYSMVVHKGDLYCGTGRYDWVTTSLQTCDPVRVYRYKGGTHWVDCGQPGINLRVLSLATYKGELYAGTDCIHEPKSASTGKVFRYAGGQEWIDCGRLGDTNEVYCLMVHNGDLYGGTSRGVYRYKGDTDWAYVGTPSDETQIHCLQVYSGKLYSGSWPKGSVCRYEGGKRWTNCGNVGLPVGMPPDGNDVEVRGGQLRIGEVVDVNSLCRVAVPGYAPQSYPELIIDADMGASVSNGWFRIGMDLGGVLVQFSPGYAKESQRGFFIIDNAGRKGGIDAMDMGFVPANDVMHHMTVHWKQAKGELDITITDGANPANVFNYSWSDPSAIAAGGGPISLARYGNDDKLSSEGLGLYDNLLIRFIPADSRRQSETSAPVLSELSESFDTDADNVTEFLDRYGPAWFIVEDPVNEVNDLTVYNGKLYAGVIPQGQVWRYEGGTTWTMMRRLVNNANWDRGDRAVYARVPCLTEYSGALYAGTGTGRGFAEEEPHNAVGRVYSYTAGTSVAYDRGLTFGWKHLVAVKDASVLRLYVDGKLQAASRLFEPEDYDISNHEILRIGLGSVDYFTGTMDELKIYRRALSPKEVVRLHELPAD